MCLQSLKPVLKRTLVVLCIAHTAHIPLWGWNWHQSFSQKNMAPKKERKYKPPTKNHSNCRYYCGNNPPCLAACQKKKCGDKCPALPRTCLKDCTGKY